MLNLLASKNICLVENRAVITERNRPLLYGDHDLSNHLNRSILELTLRFIHETGRFD